MPPLHASPTAPGAASPPSPHCVTPRDRPRADIPLPVGFALELGAVLGTGCPLMDWRLSCSCTSHPRMTQPLQSMPCLLQSLEASGSRDAGPCKAVPWLTEMGIWPPGLSPHTWGKPGPGLLQSTTKYPHPFGAFPGGWREAVPVLCALASPAVLGLPRALLVQGDSSTGLVTDGSHQSQNASTP